MLINLRAEWVKRKAPESCRKAVRKLSKINQELCQMATLDVLDYKLGTPLQQSFDHFISIPQFT